MRVLDLFSGIGGFSLGLERAGMRTVQFVEIDPFCRAVLAKHWPDVPCHDDIRTFNAPAGFADVICGGFPCQDISVAGKGAGLAGARSGLWSEYARLISDIRPRFVVVENVAALLGRGLAEVLGDLAALGFDAEWHCVPASAVGAPHRRDRVWIVAYSPKLFCNGGVFHGEHAKSQISKPGDSGSPQDVADANGSQRQRDKRPFGVLAEHPDTGGGGWWASEPDVGRVAYGVPARVDRLKALGNAVVPQIPEIIGRAIMNSVATV